MITKMMILYYNNMIPKTIDRHTYPSRYIIIIYVVQDDGEMKALRPASRKSSSDYIRARSHREHGKSSSTGSHRAREVCTASKGSHRKQVKAPRPREVIELEKSPSTRSQQVRDGRPINRHTIFCRTVI